MSHPQKMGRVLRWTMISKQLKGLAKKKEVNVQDVEVSQRSDYHLHILAKTRSSEH